MLLKHEEGGTYWNRTEQGLKKCFLYKRLVSRHRPFFHRFIFQAAQTDVNAGLPGTMALLQKGSLAY